MSHNIAVKGFSQEDQEQFAQLIGYSVSGFGDLSYVSDDTFDNDCGGCSVPVIEESYEWSICELYKHESFEVAGGSASTENEARTEMNRYELQYAQDGPVKTQLFHVTRRVI